MPYPHVSSPIRLRHRTLTGRITFGAHTANMSEGGLPGARHLGYYRERARGGAAMIVVEPMPVHPTAVLTRGNFRPGDDAVIDGFRAIADACREAAPDVVLVQQLYHVGQHGDADNSFAPNWSPSGMPSYHDADGSHAMTEDEIEAVIEGFVGAARRVRAAGFDGVELFAAYHALPDQFWTPWSNRRTDRWGGSFEGRMRFSSEVLSRIRAACGEDFIIGLAVSHDAGSAVTLSLEELATVVAWHDERRLMDYVSCGTGSYVDFYPIIPVSLYDQRLGVRAAAALKRAVRHALVQAESHIRTPDAAEAVLAAGEADLVSIVRGQIADPQLVAKARADRAADIRPCISCNQLCWGRRSRDLWISCLVNPSAGREWEWGGDRFDPAPERRRVVVVGGGPAGLEAARVAAERGHEVILLERDATLGGQFRLAGRQPSRGAILDLLGWYERQLAALGVDVRCGVRADAALVETLGADEIVVATGSRPPRTGYQRALPEVERLPGVTDPSVLAIHDVLDATGAGLDAGPVVLLDDLDDWRGLGTATAVAEQGHEVTLVTSSPVAARGLASSAADGPLRRRYVRAGGRWRTSTVMTAWEPGVGAHVRGLLDGTADIVPATTLVIAETPQPVTDVADALRARGVAVREVGDGVAARRASLAIYEGRALGRAL